MKKSSLPNNLQYTEWTVTETAFQPEKLNYLETVFTIGNGYLGTRGSFEEGYLGESAITLIHGVYDHIPIAYTELANCPNWLPLSIIIQGDRFKLNEGKILHYTRELDIRRGLLNRYVKWCSPNDKIVDLQFERFASLDDEHILGVSLKITPVNFDGEIEVQASLNGYPSNNGVLHWQWRQQGNSEIKNGKANTKPYIWFELCTLTSQVKLAMAANLNVTGCDADIQVKGCEGNPALSAVFSGKKGETVTLEKIISVFTSRDTDDVTKTIIKHIDEQPDYHQLRLQHQEAWEKTWEDCDILIEGDIRSQIAIRYNLFQLIISAPRNDDRVSVGAKSLSGLGYRGHVFWDTEIFILPFFIFIQPHIARNLLMYRYHTLNGARRKARNYGYPGAVFSWESADTGDEVTPRWKMQQENPIRIFCGDHELHLTADIAYSIWQYWEVTQDDDWIVNYGAEIVLNTAIFWGARLEWNGKLERYELRDVIGPDEYHERIDNNAFTNRMIQWHLEKALFIFDWLKKEHPEKAQELEKELEITSKRLNVWSEIVNYIWIPYDSDRQLIEQFDYFFTLENINLEDYEPRNTSINKVLGAEKTNKIQVLKQPDVLMLMYILRDHYDKDTIQRNWDYYENITDHVYGSSLGPSIHAILACILDQPEEAYTHFMRAAMVDLEDVRSNAYEGIHAASTGGLWQAVIFGFGGIKITPDGLVANPHLPPSWKRLKFRLKWHDQWYDFDLT